MTRGVELQAVRREGKRIRAEHIEVRAIASLRSHPRVGVIVPKYKRSAVDRNQLKRRLREIIRIRLLPVLPAVDVVIRARPEAYGASFAQLEQELTRAIGALQRIPPAAAAPEST